MHTFLSTETRNLDFLLRDVHKATRPGIYNLYHIQDLFEPLI